MWWPWEELVDLVLPRECAGCATAGATLCPGCVADLAAQLFASPREVRPVPAPPGLPLVVAASRYAGAARAAIVAFKDEGRADLARLLGPLLAAALGSLLQGESEQVIVVPMPSSAAATRRRGERPVLTLARVAVGQLARSNGPPSTPSCRVVAALVTSRVVADQARLGAQERARNLSGAYAVSPRHTALVRSHPVVLVDDVVTTGATLAEAARAVRAVGGEVIGATVIAATERRQVGGVLGGLVRVTRSGIRWETHRPRHGR